jgi:hypothetical protein
VSSSGSRIGIAVGLLTFTVGVGLLGLTFYAAYELFSKPPHVALGLRPGAPLQVEAVGSVLIAIGFRVLLLLMMCVTGSVVATRGIRLAATLQEGSPPQAPASSAPSVEDLGSNAGPATR